MLQKDGSILIDANYIRRGVADSPYLGIAHMRNLDIDSVRGAMQIQRKTTLAYSPTDLITSFARDPRSGFLYGCTFQGVIYKSINSGLTWTILLSDGVPIISLKVWEDYLHIVRSGRYDVFGPLSGSAALTTSFHTLTTSVNHPTWIGRNNKLYIGNVNKVAEVSNFVTGSPPTASWDAAALDLPTDNVIRCFCEVGRYLCSGTFIGAQLYDNAVADVYPWDKNSPSFEDPVRFNDNGVTQLLNQDTTLVANVGVTGRLVSGNLSTFTQEYKKIPINLLSGENLANYAEACGWHNGEMLFGLSQFGGRPNPLGIWSQKNGAWMLRNTISTGSDGSSSLVRIGAVLSISTNQYILSWQDGSTYGIDIIDSDVKYDNYQSYLESELYPVGSNLDTKTYQQAEYYLGKPLVTGQSIRIKARYNLTDTYFTIGTFDTNNTLSGSISHNFDALIEDAVNAQIRIELSQTTAAGTDQNIQFKGLRIF